MPHLLIAGCGAAGMYAAVHAARRGCRVTVLDGNDRPGHKLSITGKGRCNVTNACDLDTFLQNVPRNPRFLYSALSRCMPADVQAFFEAEGVPLKPSAAGGSFRRATAQPISSARCCTQCRMQASPCT